MTKNVPYQAVVPALAALLIALPAFSAQPGQARPGYETDFNSIMRLGFDLHEVLDPRFSGMLHPDTVFLSADATPFARPDADTGEDRLPAVFVSAGFVTLMNNIAHARAIDRIENGYFERYLLLLSRENGDTPLEELPNASDSRYWSDRIMDEQRSHWSQMVATVVAMNMAHHYLGHFQKHEQTIPSPDRRSVPITHSLSLSEWESAVKAGAEHALTRSLAIDGIQLLFEAIDKMPSRPAWTAYFLHDKARVSRLHRDLNHIEERFFGLRE